MKYKIFCISISYTVFSCLLFFFLVMINTSIKPEEKMKIKDSILLYNKINNLLRHNYISQTYVFNSNIEEKINSNLYRSSEDLEYLREMVNEKYEELNLSNTDLNKIGRKIKNELKNQFKTILN